MRLEEQNKKPDTKKTGKDYKRTGWDLTKNVQGFTAKDKPSYERNLRLREQKP